MGNPKVILFYAGFLPAFMDLGSLGLVDVAAVSAIVVSVLMAVNCAYAWWASRIGAAVGGSRTARRPNRGAGAVMAGTGVVIVTR